MVAELGGLGKMKGSPVIHFYMLQSQCLSNFNTLYYSLVLDPITFMKFIQNFIVHPSPVPSLCHRNIWHFNIVLKYWTSCYGDASYILFLDQTVTICYPTSTYATGKDCALHFCFSLF